ncbi:fibronectin type III domain-containing protein [Goodfellowiella coeruleoviolacea]|uniref:Fibronectin type-III domain-containing protein n=1 Tax=Goodfellowiella coeruleoviolacea TaxID=334858 RepID=A0AAE3KGB2_9PSEU|nr:hypothetical protein [Goodfellowiella coeruleoviolacea]MCP2167106.1 hypothetical protein [Goodfellowiella coeruleoviolacea]
MNGWRFDAGRFVDEVLKPVQDGWRPDEDLFRVYLLSLDVTDTSVLRTALDEVGRQFTNQQYRSFSRALGILRGQHQAAEEVLLDRARREKHREHVTQARDRLANVVRQRLHGAPGLPPDEVSAVARRLKVPRGAVLTALRANGADERTPSGLPPAPQPGRWAEVRGILTRLRHDSLWDYLSGLGGLPTTGRHLAARREKLRVSRSAETAAEATLLRLVQDWINDGSLTEVLRYEALAQVWDRAAYGYTDAVAATSAMAERLRELDIRMGAGEIAYAVWCAQQFAAGATEPSWQEHYQQALGDLRLRAALLILQQQPTLPDEWARQRSDLAKRLSELDDEITRCRELEATDVEAAVTGYYRIRQELADDEIDAALARCRPAAPSSARAQTSEGRVVVTWRPSTATAGRITYRIRRGNTVLAEETAACELLDPEPPSGTPVVYEIHTLRDGVPSAQATRTDPVTVLSEVLDPQLRGGVDVISGRWRLPEGAIGVLVTRFGLAFADAHLTTFTDHNVDSGQSYEYRIQVRYRLPDGSAVLSQGVLLTACCQEVPAGVTDLIAQLDGEELVATWTPPPRGDVELLELREDVDPPRCEVMPVHRARALGSPVRPTGLSGRGFLHGRRPAAGRRQTVLPITVLGDLAAIGVPFAVDARQCPVSALRLDRLGPTVRLTWAWPTGATSARVVWRRGAKPVGPTDPEASTVDITRVDYESRGVSISVPEGDYWFGVCTAVSLDGVLSFGPLVLRQESATGTVRYQVRRAGRFSRHRRTLVVEGDHRVPAVVLVAKSGIRPMHADDGEVVLHLDGRESPHSQDFDVPRHLRRPVHLRAFSLDEHVVLVPSRPDQLIV